VEQAQGVEGRGHAQPENTYFSRRKTKHPGKPRPAGCEFCKPDTLWQSGNTFNDTCLSKGADFLCGENGAPNSGEVVRHKPGQRTGRSGEHAPIGGTQRRPTHPTAAESTDTQPWESAAGIKGWKASAASGATVLNGTPGTDLKACDSILGRPNPRRGRRSYTEDKSFLIYESSHYLRLRGDRSRFAGAAGFQSPG
jgi:hypothetical protein